MTNADLIRSTLCKRPIAFYPVFVPLAGSVGGAVFMSQLLHWSDKGHDQNGWIYKTQEEWTAETYLSRREQDSARDTLKKNGILEEKKAGIPARLYYRIDFDALATALGGSAGAAAVPAPAPAPAKASPAPATPIKKTAPATPANQHRHTDRVDERTGIIVRDDEDEKSLATMVDKRGVNLLKKIADEIRSDGGRPFISLIFSELNKNKHKYIGSGEFDPTKKRSPAVSRLE